MERGFSMLTLAVVAIIVCVVVAAALFVLKGGKNQFNDAYAQINNLTAGYDEPSLQVYDGTTITGKELVQLIDEKAAADCTIKVKTSAGTLQSYDDPADYTTAIEADAKDTINERATFVGSVDRDANQAVTGLTFKQE